MLQDLTAFNGEIVHQIPGRMRIKIPNLLKLPDNVQKLQQALASLSGVKHVRINSAAESIVIDYQESQISEVDLQKQLATILTAIAPKTSKETRSHSPNEPIAN